MVTPPETYLTVRQHADDLAREGHPRSWRQHRNEPLDQLFPAIWLDQFEDETTHSLLLAPDEVKEHRKGFTPLPDRAPVRVMLWRLLPKADYWTPDAVRNAREGEHLWQEMADLPWDDYDDAYRCRRIEQVVILGSAFKRWKDRYWTRGRARLGRKEGSGSLAKQDAPFVEKMREICKAGTEPSEYAAAGRVVQEDEDSEAPKMAGGGTSLSKQKRLYKRYKEQLK